MAKEHGSLINITIRTTFNSFSTERRFADSLTLIQLKRLLEGLTGASPGNMKLNLYNAEGTLIRPLSEDTSTLADAGVSSGMTIRVEDPFIGVGQFEDTSQVKKFELSDEEYANRTESLRSFKLRNQIGRFNQSTAEERAEQVANRDEEVKKRLDQFHIGDRCSVTVSGQSSKTATIMFSGVAEFKPGYWIGVKYDQPLGKHDGSINGKRYFVCPEKHGAFVKPDNVTVGDYPADDHFFIHEI